MSTVTTVRGDLKLRQQLSALRLTPQKRRWLNRTLGRKVVSYTKKHVREQKDIHGKAFAKRKDGTRKKMERGLARRVTAKPTKNGVRVSWNNKLMAQIAYAQQHGIDQVMTASQAKKIHGKPNYKGPATRKQAKALREAGYKIRRGRGWKTPTLKYITENLKLGQAGLVLRLLRKKQSKKSWKIKLEKRAFLGVRRNETQELSNIIADQLIKLH